MGGNNGLGKSLQDKKGQGYSASTYERGSDRQHHAHLSYVAGYR